MENQTCFDLNTALENWRTELAAQPGLSPDDATRLRISSVLPGQIFI